MYFVYNFQCLLYIGIAANIHKRWNHWSDHHRKLQLEKLKAYKIEWLEVKQTDRESLMITERVLINSLNPLLNDTKTEQKLVKIKTVLPETNYDLIDENSCDLLSDLEKASAKSFGMSEVDYAMMTNVL